MGHRITLPDGWAELRDPQKVPERYRRPLIAVMGSVSQEGWIAIVQAGEDGKPVQLPAGDLAVLSAANDKIILALVESWSFEQPVTDDGLLDLPGDAYAALRTECVKYTKDLFPSFKATADPGSPTKPSNGSSPTLEGSQVTPTPSYPPTTVPFGS